MPRTCTYLTLKSRSVPFYESFSYFRILFGQNVIYYEVNFVDIWFFRAARFLRSKKGNDYLYDWIDN